MDWKEQLAQKEKEFNLIKGGGNDGQIISSARIINRNNSGSSRDVHRVSIHKKINNVIEKGGNRKEHYNVGNDNPNHRHGECIRTNLKCIDCGKEVKRYDAERCWECRAKWLKIPENNSNWKGGLSFEDYSLEWTEALKESIRKRDNYECAICYKSGKDVHHIDYNKQNCNKENLITLCIGCNAKVNFNRDYWKNYLINIKHKIGGVKVITVEGALKDLEAIEKEATDNGVKAVVKALKVVVKFLSTMRTNQLLTEPEKIEIAKARKERQVKEEKK